MTGVTGTRLDAGVTGLGATGGVVSVRGGGAGVAGAGVTGTQPTGGSMGRGGAASGSMVESRSACGFTTRALSRILLSGDGSSTR
jgi:hypothetical protein